MKWFLIFFCTAIFQLAFADTTWEATDPAGFSVKGQISNPTLSLFDREIITLELTYPAGYQPDIQAIKESVRAPYGFSPFPFAIAHEKILPSEKLTEGNLKQVISFELNPRMVGSHNLSFNPIIFKSDGSPLKAPFNLAGGTITLTVVLPSDFVAIDRYTPPLLPWPLLLPVDIDAKAQAQRLIDNQKPSIVREDNLALLQKKSIPWKGLTFVTLFLAATLLYIFYPHLFKKQLTKQPPQKSPSTRAIERLHQLTQLNLMAQQRYGDFYTQLKQIVDDFLEEHYHLPIKTTTAEEILKNPDFVKIIADIKSPWLSDWILKAEKVKYGKDTLQEANCREDLVKIEEFINNSSNAK